MSVSSIGKPAGRPCDHECERGCAIYETRPDQCRSDFYCLWIRDHKGLLGDEHRPDRLGLVLTHDRDPASSDVVGVAAREVFPGAGDRPEAARVIEYLRQFVPTRLVRAPDRAARDIIDLTVEATSQSHTTP